MGDFLNLPTASTPLSALLGADLNVANLLTEPGVKNDTLLAQIGALELKFHLEARIAAKLAQEALGLTTLDDMVTNPLKLAEAIKNPSSIIERGNADITTFKGGLGKVASFISDVSGLGGLTSAFFTDDSIVLRPTCFSESEYGAYDIEKKIEERDIQIPHVILPHRRDGKFFCLPHQTEGLINVGGIDKWAKGETTARNERRYVLQMQQGKIDYKLDGINNMNYEYINTDIIFDKHKMINVKTK